MFFVEISSTVFVIKQSLANQFPQLTPGICWGMPVCCGVTFLPSGCAGRYTRLRLSGKDFSLQFEPRDQFEQRQKKLEQIQALGLPAYPNEFRWSDTVAELVTK